MSGLKVIDFLCTDPLLGKWEVTVEYKGERKLFCFRETNDTPSNLYSMNLTQFSTWFLDNRGWAVSFLLYGVMEVRR